LQKLAIPVWTRPTGALGGSFPLMTRQKLKSNYLNSTRTNPHPLKYLYISGGVSSPHPPKTIFLRRDILFVRYVIYYIKALWAEWPLLGRKLPKKARKRQKRQILQSYNTARFVQYGKIHVKYGTAYYIIRIRRMTHPWPEPYIHGVFTVFWAGKPPNVRSYTVYSVYIRFWPTLTIACATFIHWDPLSDLPKLLRHVTNQTNQ